MTTPSERTYSTYRCEAKLQKCGSLTTRTVSEEPPRSTAYYYADLERFKRKEPADELSEYVETNEVVVVNDGPIREVPPLRDRQWSLPEYNTPENSRKGETYSTAGTFPMPETKEKEPLLAELEVVGRLPLTQLDSASGVRRSRSWYLCCPNVGEEEISRESSWRYSSLRPVTAPPAAGQNGMTSVLVATQSSGRDDVSSLRAERDALARALAAERQRAASAARAHDARLAELHGVIAELVRRRAADKHAGAIPEEEVSESSAADECESTTQPAGELDEEQSRTEQDSSLASRGQDARVDIRVEPAETVEVEPPKEDKCDTSLNLSERDSEICLSTARCCQFVRGAGSAGTCDREHGSADAHAVHAVHAVFAASPGRCESRQAKIASRVKLRRTEDTDSNKQDDKEQSWCAAAAERLALDVCAQADLREALLAGSGAAQTSLAALAARCSRLQADCAVLTCAVARAHDTAHRLYCACAVQESWCVSLCVSLRAADLALETYDVLLALSESSTDSEREAAQLVARQLLAKLDSEQSSATIGEPLLSPGPWLQHHTQAEAGEWSAASEARLRAHAARLKVETVRLRPQHPPTLFSYHDIDEEEIPKSVGTFSMAEMEAAVCLQEVLSAREARAARAARDVTECDSTHSDKEHKATRGRRRARRHWLDTQASETDL